MAGLMGVSMACARAPERLDVPETASLAVPQPRSAEVTAPAVLPVQPGPRSAPATASADEIPDTLAASTRADVATLLDAHTFATGGVGITGEPTNALLAAEHLVAQRDAVAAFEWLVVNGSAAGRLYGYWGLHTLAPARAAAHAPELTADTDPVAMMGGCIGYERTVGGGLAQAPSWPPLTAGRHQRSP